MEAALPSHKRHGETVDPELMIRAVVSSEPVIRNTVAFVSAALLPGAMIGLPVVRTVALPSYLWLVCLFPAALAS